MERGRGRGGGGDEEGGGGVVVCWKKFRRLGDEGGVGSIEDWRRVGGEMAVSLLASTALVIEEVVLLLFPGGESVLAGERGGVGSVRAFRAEYMSSIDCALKILDI